MDFVGAPELLVILVVVLVVFGPAKLPKLARSFGEAVHEFRQGDSGEAHPNESIAADGPRREPPAPGDSFI